LNKKIIPIVLLILAFSGLTLFVMSKVRPVGNRAVRIGVLQAWILEGPFYVAREKGFFAQEGVEAEIVEIGSVNEFVPALVSGEILVAELIADMFIVQASRVPNIRQILRKATIFGVDGIVASGDIQTAADLKGKRIAVQTVSPSHYLLLNYLKDSGISSSDVTLLPTEAGQAGAAFRAGKIDAAVTWEPWLKRASEREDGHILFSTKDSPELIYDILVTRGDLSEPEKDSVRKVLRAWFKALAWMEENPAETIDIFSRNLGLPKEEVAFFFSKLKFMNHSENLSFFGSRGKLGPVKEYSEKASALWLSEKIIDQTPVIDDIIDPDYLNGLYP